MVRKSSRSSLKAMEKAKNESPKRSRIRSSNRRRKSTSNSEDSEDDVAQTGIKSQTPEPCNKDSSDNESENAKSPGKARKRGRSSVNKEDPQNNSPDRRSRKGRDRGSPAPKTHAHEQQEDEGEVKEDKKSKGKSKSKHKSNNDTSTNVVDAETESENVQVTEQSPNTKAPFDERIPNVIEATTDERNNEATKGSIVESTENGQENTQINVQVNETVVAEISCEKNSIEISSEDTIEIVATSSACTKAEQGSEDTTQDNSEEVNLVAASESDQQKSELLTEISSESNNRRSRKNYSKDSSEKSSDRHSRRRRSRERQSSERSSRDESTFDEEKCSNKINEENSQGIQNAKNESSKKIKLKRPPSETYKEQEGKKEESGTRKIITLKRNKETKLLSLEDPKPNTGENDSLSPKGLPPQEDWSSQYETNHKQEVEHNKGPSKGIKEEGEDRPARKKISLNRTTVDEKKTSLQVSTDNEAKDKKSSLERRISLQDNSDERRRNSSTSEVSADEKKRRHSTAFEKSGNETEGSSIQTKPRKPKKPTKTIKLVRNIFQEPSPPGEESVKKYKWGTSEIPFTNVEPLNLESLKQVCPTIEFLKDEEVNLEIIKKEREGAEKERRRTYTETEEEEMEKIEEELREESEDPVTRENIIAMNRKISIVDDTASKMRPPPSPAKNPTSEVLFITNLVRPFTVKQLKELLERTGKIREEGFWTDRIKSKCYVCYQSAEEAEATRNALHGVNWPIGNGKKLNIDYATVEDLETAKNPPLPVRKEKTPEKENKKPDREEKKEERKPDRTVTREWDMGKEEVRRHRSKSRSRERVRKHSRRSYTPEDIHDKRRKREEPVSQKAMDDLFSKTKATPSIYWQPLSPQEIALKQHQRQVRMEEHKRRLHEIRTTVRPRDQIRDRGRDRNFRRR